MKTILAFLLFCSSLMAEDIIRAGYSNGSNIKFYISQDVYMSVFMDIKPDWFTSKSDYDELVKKNTIKIKKGYYELQNSGYYIMLFTPVETSTQRTIVCQK